MTCHPTAAGNFTIVATLGDALGVTHASTLLLRVAPDPKVTSFNSTPDVTDVGVPFNLTVVVSGGIEPFSFGYEQLPVGCTPPDAPSLVCTPSLAGASTVNVTIFDAWQLTVV